MTREEVLKRYFDWMCRLVCNREYPKKSYNKLLNFLDSVEFTYIIDMDDNRATDGINLRYRYGYEENIDSRIIASYLDDHDCTVLEMMVALALRCEETIMYDPEYGDRTSEWFWVMIKNLGLDVMTNAYFDVDYSENVIDVFLNREYDANGRGGLFRINDVSKDLRDVEIWYQMCWYLNDLM